MAGNLVLFASVAAFSQRHWPSRSGRTRHAIPAADGSADEGLPELQRCVLVAELECRAKQCVADGDLAGEAASYRELLSLEPPTAPWLSAATSARRGLQELLLQSAQQELEQCGEEGCRPDPGQFGDHLGPLIQQARRAGEEVRQTLASRSLDDVDRIRSLVVGLLERGESEALADAERAQSAISYTRLVEGDPAIFASWQLEEARRRLADSRLLRKSIENDLNRLELQLLQGDPSLAFLRAVLFSSREAGEMPPPPDSVWLREQLETGALPRDPELLRTLIEQARVNPQLVARLVTQAKDNRGKDMTTRFRNDPALLEGRPESLALDDVGFT